ncbi:COG1470 family protein [Brevibacillus laterosporus]|uniref:COG1470 family protein n=1 Tax=Brevibacillus laterosporus TaxID=1465 RepID=UPI001EF89283|nr:hypothetical protein [Brevibacillus laterosporus]
MAKNNDTKSELGKIIVVFGTVLGIGAGSIFWLNQFVFDSKNATAVITTSHPEIAKNAGSEVVPKLSETESSEPQPPVVEKVNNPSGAVFEPFYASLQMGEYVAVYNQDGTEKVLSFDLTKEEVKTLLGKPKSESYVDDETRSLCYRYDSFSIFFDDEDQYISHMTYEGTKELLNKQWLSSLTKTLDSGDVNFYESPTRNTMVKVDHLPETNEVFVYLVKQYPRNKSVTAPSTEQPHVIQTPAPTPQSPNTSTEERMNADGECLLSPGEEIVIENIQVTNDSRVHTTKYFIDVNYHFAFNSPNMVKVITDPEKTLELMPGETATVQIKVKASKSAPKASYRFIVSLKQGWSVRPLKDFTVEVK